MTLTMIQVPGVKPIAPYSPAVKANGFIFISGQLGIANGAMVEGIEAQTRQCMENLGNILKLSGTSFEKIVKCQIFLTDMNDFDVMNKIYGSYFPVHKPARFCVQIAKMALNGLVEIDAVAVE